MTVYVAVFSESDVFYVFGGVGEGALRTGVGTLFGVTYKVEESASGLRVWSCSVASGLCGLFVFRLIRLVGGSVGCLPAGGLFMCALGTRRRGGRRGRGQCDLVVVCVLRCSSGGRVIVCVRRPAVVSQRTFLSEKRRVGSASCA